MAHRRQPAQPSFRVNSSVGLYKGFVHSKAIFHYSTILVLPPPSALLTLLQYYRTTIRQYATPTRPPLVYAIHHTILAAGISCKGQLIRGAAAIYNLHINTNIVMGMINRYMYVTILPARALIGWRSRSPALSLYTILQCTILYGVWRENGLTRA